MIPRAFAVSLVLPVLFAAVVLAAAAVNGRSGRGPTIVTEREALLAFRSDDRPVAQIGLAWTEPAGEHGAWLTRETLVALGFDLSVEASDPRAESHYRGQLTRRAFVAFELDGPAWQAVLSEREQGERAAGRAGRGVYDGLRAGASRLVPVAADRDAAVLAQRYPDPRTHLITAVTIRVFRAEVPDGRVYVGGTLLNVDPPRIRIPVEHASKLPRRPIGKDGRRTPLTISLMYGSRWEPWVAAVGP
jgi:hypothetical protein